MTDAADDAADLVAARLARSLGAIGAAIPAGVAGQCAECGEDMPRLVGGRCGYCRDGRRPPLSRFDDRLSPAAEVPPANRSPQEEAPMTSMSYTNVNVHLRGAVRDAVRARAASGALTNGQAIVELIQLAIMPRIEDEPVAEVSSPSDLAEYPLSDLLDELQRRFAEAQADDEALREANSRAEAAEQQLASLRQKIGALVQ